MHYLNEPDVGNWSQIHFFMASKPLAIPFAMEINGLGSMTFFDAVTTTDACRYSNLAISSSLLIPSPVYILTCIYTETQMNEMKCKLKFLFLYETPSTQFSRTFYFKKIEVFIYLDCSKPNITGFLGKSKWWLY